MDHRDPGRTRYLGALLAREAWNNVLLGLSLASGSSVPVGIKHGGEGKRTVKAGGSFVPG